MRKLIFGLILTAVCLTPAFPDTLNFTGAAQTYTVAATGEYQIIAYGAQGGNSNLGPVGGNGAEIGGNFNLTAGEMLSIYVGGQPGVGLNFGGGGGGTFVVASANTNPLVVAGGGGGANQTDSLGAPGGAALTTNSGSIGGLGGAFFGAGGGGGFAGDGGDASGASQGVGGFGGKGFAVLTGGDGAESFLYSPGGFGGGGGAGAAGGGGGGGFSGGNGGDGDLAYSNGGTGGGSFDAGTAQILIAGENSGNGFVVITPVVQGTPEPASLAFVGASLVGIYFLGRKRLEKANRN